MRKKRNKIIKIVLNKYFVFISIVTLVLFWIGCSFAYFTNNNLSLITYSKTFSDFNNSMLLENEKVSGEFKSQENYLGSLSIKFNDFIKPEFNKEDIIVFRLKEKGSKKWYYENKYRTGQIKDSLFFPFGFPVINNSDEKVYEFEIQSLNGQGFNSISVTNIRNNLLVTHLFPTSEIIVSKNAISNHLIKKFTYSIRDMHFILNSIIFAVPLILFLFFVGLNKNRQKTLSIFKTMLILSVLIDILLIRFAYPGILIINIFIFLSLIYQSKIKYNAVFRLAAFFIFCWCLFNFFQIQIFTEKLNIYTYLFLVIGVFLLVYENRKFNK